MTGRAIIAIALAATCFLMLGARLLESPTAAAAIMAALALTVGTALAALAVAAAWRPVPQDQPETDPVTERPSHTPAASVPTTVGR
jgi:hypothetical protein